MSCFAEAMISYCSPGNEEAVQRPSWAKLSDFKSWFHLLFPGVTGLGFLPFQRVDNDTACVQKKKKSITGVWEGQQ